MPQGWEFTVGGEVGLCTSAHAAAHPGLWGWVSFPQGAWRAWVAQQRGLHCAEWEHVHASSWHPWVCGLRGHMVAVGCRVEDGQYGGEGLSVREFAWHYTGTWPPVS